MRTNRMIRAILGILWSMVFSYTVLANGPIEQVALAIERMDERERFQWAFVRTIQMRDRVLVARHDPRQGHPQHRWRLESVNGKPPTKKERAKFYEQVDKADSTFRDDEGTAPAKISSLVPLESLRLSSTNERNQATFEFTPRMNDVSFRNRDVFVGELVFDLASQHVKTISVRNTTMYSPAFSVKISTFNMRMQFEPMEGDVLLTEMATHIQGKALFKKIDEEVRMIFGDYEWVEHRN